MCRERGAQTSLRTKSCTGNTQRRTGSQQDQERTGNSSPEIALSMYSARICEDKGNVLVDFDLFIEIIEETAYHVVRHGDMKSKSEYQDIGRRLLLAYPCLE